MSAYAQAAGAVAGAVSQYSAGQSQQKIGEANADILRSNADTNLTMANQTAQDNAAIIAANLKVSAAEAAAIEEQGAQAADYKRTEVRKLLAYQRVQEAISGFRYSGTAVDVAKESRAEGEADIATIWNNAATNAKLTREKARIAALSAAMSNYRIVQSATSNSNALNAQANTAANAGSYAASAGTSGAMSTLLKGLSDAYTTYNKPTNTKIG